MMMRCLSCVMTMLMAAWAAPAAAVNLGDEGVPYIAAQYAHEINDRERLSERGKGFQITAGLPIRAWPQTALELSYYSVQRKRDIDGNRDYQTALSLDFVYDFGVFGWLSSLDENPVRLPHFSPFVLLGISAVQDDVAGVRETYPGLNAGLGLLIDTGFRDWAVRTEARVLAQDNDQSVPGQERLLDYRLSLGLQIPLAFFGGGERIPVPPLAAQPLPAVKETPVAPGCTPAGQAPVPGRPACVSDADGDGVPDDQDICPETPARTAVDGRGCPVIVGTQIIKGVNFLSDSARLTAASLEALNRTAATLQGYNGRNAMIEIAGHTDATGSEAQNLRLSQQRAETVRDYLISRGVNAAQLVARGYGSSRPVADNQTEQGKALNRRVEFRIELQ